MCSQGSPLRLGTPISWVPIDWHPVSGAEGCGPQVRELGLGGAGNHVFRPLCWHSLGAPNLAVEERPRLWGQGLYRFTPSHKAQTPAGFPKHPSACWKSKGFILPGGFTCGDFITFTLAGWPSPASGTVQPSRPLTTMSCTLET